MLDRDSRLASRQALQKAPPVVPGYEASWVVRLFCHGTNVVQRPDLFGVTPKRQLELGLLDYSIQAPKAVWPHFRHRIEPVKGIIKIRDGFVVSTTASRFFCSSNRVTHRLFGLITATEVKRKQFCDFFGATSVKLLERVSDGGVTGAAVTIEQAAVSGFLRQRVAKSVNGSFHRRALRDEFEAAQLA